mgnify:CR=1 FL=1
MTDAEPAAKANAGDRSPMSAPVSHATKLKRELRAKRYAQGLCASCDAPRREGKKSCADCTTTKVLKQKTVDPVDTIIRQRAAAHRVPVLAVLASSRAIARARRDIVVALTACGLSQAKIAKRLGLTLHGVQRHQAAAAIEPAGKKAA